MLLLSWKLQLVAGRSAYFREESGADPMARATGKGLDGGYRHRKLYVVGFLARSLKRYSYVARKDAI